MTDNERHCLAILRAGGSFGDAMDACKLTLEQVQKLWEQHGKAA